MQTCYWIPKNHKKLQTLKQPNECFVIPTIIINFLYNLLAFTLIINQNNDRTLDSNQNTLIINSYNQYVTPIT